MSKAKNHSIAMPSQEVLEESIRHTLSKHFKNIDVQHIAIREDVGYEGDRVLRVDVIFMGTPKHADVEKMTGATRLLRSKLDEINETAFPVLSFISSSDYKAHARR